MSPRPAPPGKVPGPVPCSAPSSCHSYFLSSISLLLSAPLLPSSPSPWPQPLPRSLLPAQPGTRLPSAFPQQDLPPPLTFSHPPAISDSSNPHPCTPAGEDGPRCPPSPRGTPTRAPPENTPTAAEKALKWSLGVGVPFLSIQRRFPGPSALANTYRGFPVRRRMLSWAAGCSGAGRGGPHLGLGTPRCLLRHTAPRTVS